MDDTNEVLIKEAKQRARRRRWIYGGAVIVLAIAAIAAITLPGSPSSAHRATRAVPNPPTPPTPLGAPLVQGPDAASTLLTSWSGFHVGYVFVYADGRVLWSPLEVLVDSDNRVTGIPIPPWFWLDGHRLRKGLSESPEGEFRTGNIERRLSPRGLDLVRQGKVEVKHFLVQPYEQFPAKIRPLSRWPIAVQLYLRKDLWVKPTARLREPTAYALCPTIEGGIETISVNATDIVDELPAPVRAVLDGKQRNFDPSIGTAHWGSPTGGLFGRRDCFELTAAETSNLYQMLVANGLINKKGQEPIRGPQGWDRVFNYGNLSLLPDPIFPHGQYVLSFG